MIDGNTIVTLIVCHLIGDYILQTEFLAKTKGDNFYHLLVHCVLYCVPFAYLFGVDWRIGVLFVTHVLIDWWKCRGTVGYAEDQFMHYLTAFVIYAR